jgi:hypothetical protein
MTVPQLLMTSADTDADPAPDANLYMCADDALCSVAVTLVVIDEPLRVMGSCTAVAEILPVGTGFGAQPSRLAIISTSSCRKVQHKPAEPQEIAGRRSSAASPPVYREQNQQHNPHCSSSCVAARQVGMTKAAQHTAPALPCNMYAEHKACAELDMCVELDIVCRA